MAPRSSSARTPGASNSRAMGSTSGTSTRSPSQDSDKSGDSSKSSDSGPSLSAALAQACEGGPACDGSPPRKKLRRWGSGVLSPVAINSDHEGLAGSPAAASPASPASEGGLGHALQEACCAKSEDSSEDVETPDCDPMGFPLPRQPSSKPPSKWFTQEGVPDVPLAPVMRKMLLALSPAMAARMVGQVANLNAWIDDSCLDGLPLTTSCSGTDLILPVLNLFFLIATLMMGVPLIQPRHLWSCESDSQKAAWITQVMGIGRIFADVGDLSSGLAKEHFTSLMGQVSSGLIHACGFNCQSVSGLNKQRKMFNRCIRKRKGKTGVSWWGTFSYVRRFLPLFVWLENVSTLLGDNLADVLSLLRMIGYIVVHFVLDHCHHGVPGHRNRLWIIAKLAPLASIADQEFAQMQASQLELALRQDPEPLSAFLDPAEDDMHAPQKRRQAPRAKAKSKSSARLRQRQRCLRTMRSTMRCGEPMDRPVSRRRRSRPPPRQIR